MWSDSMLTYAINVRSIIAVLACSLSVAYAVNYKISLAGSERHTFHTFAAIAGGVASVSAFSFVFAWIAGRT